MNNIDYDMITKVSRYGNGKCSVVLSGSDESIDITQEEYDDIMIHFDMDNLGITDLSRKSLLSVFIEQVDRLVQYVIDTSLNPELYDIEKSDYFDNFNGVLYYLFNIIEVKDLFQLDLCVLLEEFIRKAGEIVKIEEPRPTIMSQTDSYLCYDRHKMIRYILKQRELISDIIYLYEDADLDFDTRENPNSDIVPNIFTILELSNYNSLKELGLNFKRDVMKHFRDKYRMESKLLNKKESTTYLQSNIDKFNESKIYIVECIMNEVIYYNDKED